MTLQALLDRLDGVRSRGTGRYTSKCPAHADKSPSLSIQERGTRILFHCFGGCEPKQIVAALGLELKDLFTDTPTSRGQRPSPTSQKLDLAVLAHHFEMAALDRRLRADAVLNAVATFNSAELSDSQRDRLMNAVALAFEDRERAEFLETVADGWRLKKERKTHAA